MKYQIYAKNITATESLQEYIDMRFGPVDALSVDIISCRVDLSRDEKHKKGEVYRVEININLPQKLIRIVEKREDMRAAIDIATDKLLRQIKKYTNKRRDTARKLARLFKRRPKE